MTEEIKKEKCRCVEKFLLTTLAAFIGSLVALCLFSAAVKPPVKPCPCPMMPQQRFEAPVPHGMEAGGPQRREFRQEAPRKHQKTEAPAQRPNAPVNEAPKALR